MYLTAPDTLSIFSHSWARPSASASGRLSEPHHWCQVGKVYQVLWSWRQSSETLLISPSQGSTQLRPQLVPSLPDEVRVIISDGALVPGSFLVCDSYPLLILVALSPWASSPAFINFATLWVLSTAVRPVSCLSFIDLSCLSLPGFSLFRQGPHQ